MKGSEMCCSSSRDQNLGMYVSMHWGHFRIMRAGIRRKSNVRTREGAETCVCQRERAETREIKSLEIRSEIEWSITELLLHRNKKKKRKNQILETQKFICRVLAQTITMCRLLSSDLWAVPVSDKVCQVSPSSLKWTPLKCHRLTRRFQLECGNTSCVTEVRSNYHLCGNKARTSCINLNNVWKKYSLDVCVQ